MMRVMGFPRSMCETLNQKKGLETREKARRVAEGQGRHMFCTSQHFFKNLILSLMDLSQHL